MTTFENRQNWDLPAWPEMYGKLKQLQAEIFLAPPGRPTNMMVFTVSSLTAGCRHCQAHGAYGLDKSGVAIDKIQALWSFESSDLFSDRERAALRFAVAASSVPSGVDATHHAAIRRHYSDEEARTLIGVVSMAAFMNRYNDSLATVTDEESATWAAINLSPVGWDIGKHVGASIEQRSGPPGAR
jgi:alkylhydroperoxidase family enzyme